MKSFLTDFLYLFYPKRCIVCGRVVHPTVDLCEDCEKELKPIMVKTCQKCGNPKKLCCCKRYVYHFRGISSPYLNEGSAQKAVYFYKFGGNKDSAQFFGKVMAERFINDFPDIEIDCVTAVPRNRKKRADKDNTLWRFDHSARLAKCVARELSVPYKPLLIKHKSNKVFIVHRLDKDTSGLIIFAKNELCESVKYVIVASFEIKRPTSFPFLVIIISFPDMTMLKYLPKLFCISVAVTVFIIISPPFKLANYIIF